MSDHSNDAQFNVDEERLLDELVHSGAPVYPPGSGRRSNYQDVKDFHLKFGVPVGDYPKLLDEGALKFRTAFMFEELNEFIYHHAREDLNEAADALVDLVYVVLGTAIWMGLPWQELWDEVQRANMSKVPAEKQPHGARHDFDVRKPEGWVPPQFDKIMKRSLRRVVDRKVR